MIYAVRIGNTEEFIGIFWGANFAEVADAVDEFASPTCCEFLKTSNGGVWNLGMPEWGMTECLFEDALISPHKKWAPFAEKFRQYASVVPMEDRPILMQILSSLVAVE